MSRIELQLVAENSALFTKKFAVWLPENFVVYDAFVDETFKLIERGFTHYSARTILHYLRHHTAISQHSNDGWKLNNDYSPYMARLFDLMHPHLSGLFEYRETPAVFYR
jgi:hypothetical protein